MSDPDAPTFAPRAFDWLDGLVRNNEAAWFRANRPAFAEALEAPFAALLDALTLRLADAPVPLAGSRATMFRMNRDVRFSADKRPYKTSVSGLMTPSGTKDEGGGCLYLELAADGGQAMCGFYRLPPAALAPIRRRIVASPDAFAEAVGALEAEGLELWRADALTAMPRGFEGEAGHPHADALRLTSIGTRIALPKVAWTSGDVAGRLERMARAAMPLLAFAGAGAPGEAG